jgi:hypothetical protein
MKHKPFIYLFIYFWGAGYQPQVLTNTRQVLYCWAMPLAETQILIVYSTLNLKKKKKKRLNFDKCIYLCHPDSYQYITHVLSSFKLFLTIVQKEDILWVCWDEVRAQVCWAPALHGAAPQPCSFLFRHAHPWRTAGLQSPEQIPVRHRACAVCSSQGPSSPAEQPACPQQEKIFYLSDFNSHLC